MTKRKTQAIKTKNKIYDTAIKLFLKKGFENVTINDITKKAGISKGSFYTHFKSKECVIIEFFERIDDFYKETYNNFHKDMTASQELLAIIRSMTEFCSNEFGLSSLKISYSYQLITDSVSSKVLIDKERIFFKILYKIASKGKASKEFSRTMSENEIVELIERSCHGLLYDWCIYNGEFDLNEAGQDYFNKVVKIICE